MPRDNVCLNCNGAFHDDEMTEADPMLCIYCAAGVDHGLAGQTGEEADDEQ